MGDWYDAMRDGDIPTVQSLIASGANINEALDEGKTPLYIASQKGNLKIVKLLLAAGADVNKAANTGSTPLFEAVGFGHNEIVKVLLAAGADVNKAMNNGLSPLHIASSNEAISLVEILLASGADVNKTTNEGSTPLYEAATTGYTELVKILLEAGADVNIYNLLKRATVGEFDPEINALILEKAGPKEMWSGFTRSDIAKFDAIFETEAPPGGRSRAENVSVCPVCLVYAERSEGCKYMRHNCMLDTGAPHKKLYNMYKDKTTGLIYWCTVCGRICDNHHHYKLSNHATKASRSPALVGAVDYYSSDCVREGGGGLMEKLARFRRMREYALELNSEVGKITKEQAMTKLVEETWDAPLPHDKKRLENIAAAKKWNISTENFLPNVSPAAASGNNAYPNIARPNANKALVPTTSRALNDFDEEQTFIQFHHRTANGEMNHHEGSLISQPILQGFIEDINKQFGTAAFGLCWDYRGGEGCTARLYPEEIKDFVTPEVYETYKKHFNKKFSALGAAGGGRRKTQKGGTDNMLKESKLAECLLPPPRKGGRRTIRKRRLNRRGTRKW